MSEPNYRDLLVNMSPQGADTLRGIAELHVKAARIAGYVAFTTEEARTLRGRLRDLRGDDLHYVLMRLPSHLNQGLREFFEAEEQFRKGEILDWVPRGLRPSHEPDLLFIRLATVPSPASSDS
jgi:hypothetical protein